jgi:hypothetical protein
VREGRELRSMGPEGAWQKYNVSFILFCFALQGKYRQKNGLKMAGEG